jgi:hypothetical protein
MSFIGNGFAKAMFGNLQPGLLLWRDFFVEIMNFL